jgi:DNA-binding CsgD family transcriptional regulator
MSANPNLAPATRAERAAEAARLRAEEGVAGPKGVAERMGISVGYARSLLYDPTGEGDRARKAKAGGSCATCGAPTSYTTGGPSRHCRKHAPNRAAAINAARAAARYERIAALWREGASLKEIAAALDSTPQSIAVTVNRLRSRGWDLPYRRPAETRRRIRAATRRAVAA